jgi:hypothetical protein
MLGFGFPAGPAHCIAASMKRARDEEIRIRAAGDSFSFGGIVPADRSVRAARELQHAPWRREAKFLSAEVGERISLHQV